MSLYNAVHGVNPDAEKILNMLGLIQENFGRFRDCYLSADGTEIIVYTRCGGDNRREYGEVFEIMEDHDNYIIDYDDEYDNTYCYFQFDTPKKFLEDARKMATGVPPLTVHEKFQTAIEEMRDPNSEAAKRAEAIANKIEKGIENNPNNGCIFL